MFIFLLVLLKVCECGQNQSIENEKKKTITEKKKNLIFMNYEHDSILAYK